MVDKEHILSEIRRTARDNSGEPLGQLAFASATGIRERDWRGRYWARWSAALQEAGFRPNQFGGRFDDDVVMAQLASEVRRLGHYPTVDELELRHRNDGSFPSSSVFRRLGSKHQIAGMLVDFCRRYTDYDDVLGVVQALLDVDAPSPPGRKCVAPEAFGFVYLLRSGRYYKLGRTNSFGRRERELALQLPERAQTVHVIKTDDPVGIERYWHTRFADRRKNGEWFELTADDVAAFRRRKFM
jgi:hypothetical protein